MHFLLRIQFSRPRVVVILNKVILFVEIWNKKLVKVAVVGGSQKGLVLSKVT